jgi:hypothetical protein
MHVRDIGVAVAYWLPTGGLMLQGLLSVTTPTFMPYHADALAVAWEDLPANDQGFVLGVIKGMGTGSVGVTLAIVGGVIFLTRSSSPDRERSTRATTLAARKTATSASEYPSTDLLDLSIGWRNHTPARFGSCTPSSIAAEIPCRPRLASVPREA